MARLLYTLFFYAALPFIVIRLWIRGRKLASYRVRIAERFGSFSPPDITHLNIDGTKPTLWIHTVSVGEFLAAAPLIQILIDTQKYNLTVTTTTPTGSEQVLRRFGKSVFHVYAPYDIPICIKAFLKKIKPQLAIFMETELWPNTLHYCEKYDVKVFLANGRLSKKSARGYKQFSYLSRPMLKAVTCAAIQHTDDASRFIELGLSQQAAKVTGSIKFDICIDSDLKIKTNALKKHYFSECKDRPILIAASTHRGEEDIVLAAYKELLAAYPDCLLILVPRHPDRFDEVARLIDSLGLKYAQRSKQEKPLMQHSVLLGDTMGELMQLFGIADVAFVGGSFINNGGHNYIEPAAWGLPIITGPSEFNFADTARQLREASNLQTVHDYQSLRETLAALLSNPEDMSRRGKAGVEVVMQNQGATQKHLVLIDELLHEL